MKAVERAGGRTGGGEKGVDMSNQIEGRLAPGQKVVLVEDLISTGESSLKAFEALKAAGAEVLGMVVIFTYGFPI